MDIKTERGAFEAWYCRNHTGLKQSDLAKFRTLSGYSFSDSLKINISWEAWQAAKAQAVPEWISVENKLPKRNIKVLLNIVARRRGKPFSCIGFYSVEPDDEPCFILDDNFTILKGVTHWMQLPQAPKAQEPNND